MVSEVARMEQESFRAQAVVQGQQGHWTTWSVSSPLTSSPCELQLENRFDILSAEEFPPLQTVISPPAVPKGLQPPTASMPGRPLRYRVRLAAAAAPASRPARRCRTSGPWPHHSKRKSGGYTNPTAVDNPASCSPLLVFGSSMVRHVEISCCVTSFHPGALVRDISDVFLSCCMITLPFLLWLPML